MYLFCLQIFGFANLFLWGASMWFVYKETMFHRKTLVPQPVGTYPGIAQQGGIPQQTQMGQLDQMGGQMQQPDQYTQQYTAQPGY